MADAKSFITGETPVPVMRCRAERMENHMEDTLAARVAALEKQAQKDQAVRDAIISIADSLRKLTKCLSHDKALRTFDIGRT